MIKREREKERERKKRFKYNITLFTMFLFLVAVSGVGLTYFVKYNYPNLALSFMYQCVYYYSYLEMLYLKLSKHNLKQLTFTSTPAVEFIKNGKIVDFQEDCDCHFRIYSQNNEKRIIKSTSKGKTFIKSSVSFILFTIELNNTTISLKLSGDDYNYYLVGNVIDSRFLWYFLNKHYNLGLTEPVTNYTLNIIDNNVNIYSITYPECFEITLDGIRVFGKITNNMKFDQSETMTDVVVELVEKESCLKVEDERKEELDERKEDEVDKEDEATEQEELEERKEGDVDKKEEEDAEQSEDTDIMIL